MGTSEIQAKIGKKWSQCFSTHSQARTRWWQSPHVLRHINQRVADSPLEDASAGLVRRAKEMAKDRLPFPRGVSVGCGNAIKEIRLLREGLVRHFQLFELSEVCIQQGKEFAAREGVADRAEFIFGDAFELVTGEECFDFVHWNNSLHHMLDVDQAIQWSYRVCRKGGMFYMDDFVGPTRFQWSDKMLQVASAVRSALPDRYLVRHSHSKRDKLKQIAGRLLSPRGSKDLHPRILDRPSADVLRADDPSEAADSGRILDCVKEYFPNAEITLSGGAIYALALNDILENFDESEDRYLLDLLMIIDDLCAELGETHYATALAIK